MKLTGEQRDDLLGEVAAYADAYADGSRRRRSDCLDCIVAVVEKLMGEAYEDGKRDAEADSNAQALEEQS